MKFNSSTTTTSPISCSYCQTMACRCSSRNNLLNCSSYLLNLTFASNCAENIIWDTVDFSLRNLESFTSIQLLSLRMHRLLLKSNLITNIYDNTFDSIGDILIELDLQMNQLTNISSKWFNSKLTQLKILNLASNQLESFIDLNNVYLPYLQELNVSCNQIDIFPIQIQQWTSLIKLDLSFNKLSSIPRFALTNLRNLSWLSLASNRNLSCIVYDSFKYLNSLKYLDLSSTNLFDLDGCLFTQLTSLHILKIERVSINCSSCWLSKMKKHSIKLFGQCLHNNTIKQLDSLTTDQQIHSSCSKSSIDCSIDYCEPGSFNIESKSFLSIKTSNSVEDSNVSKNRTIEIVLGVVFSLIGLFVIIVIIILIYRWRQGKKIFCCDVLPKTSSTTIATTRNQSRKQILNKNPTIMESVITHGAEMDVSPYSHHEYEHSDNKRNLYNPMFVDSPKSEIRHQSPTMVTNDDRFHNSQLYAENL
ncbi:unnamed protein product [Adineta steineri]|uniref:Uncharacterized protein n=2 Tax=Adineta steineri TaxID=433720 RepID=A0A818X0V6_9BILA|nr:unnamed protein product [Adineta steineri]